MNAIETYYKGYRFRSRLEARWAVFFDALDIEWIYEVEGYEKDVQFVDYKKTIKYLPDFYLPKTKTWVEIKGVFDNAEIEDLAYFLDFGSPLPHFDDSGFENKNVFDQTQPGLLILGEIPDPEYGLYFHKLITHHEGLFANYVRFRKQTLFPDSHVKLKGTVHTSGIKKYDVSEVNMANLFLDKRELLHPYTVYDSYASSDEELEELFNPECKTIETKWIDPDAQKAYKKARQARFEHGETPII